MGRTQNTTKKDRRKRRKSRNNFKRTISRNRINKQVKSKLEKLVGEYSKNPDKKDHLFSEIRNLSSNTNIKVDALAFEFDKILENKQTRTNYTPNATMLELNTSTGTSGSSSTETRTSNTSDVQTLKPVDRHPEESVDQLESLTLDQNYREYQPYETTPDLNEVQMRERNLSYYADEIPQEYERYNTSSKIQIHEDDSFVESHSILLEKHKNMIHKINDILHTNNVHIDIPKYSIISVCLYIFFIFKNLLYKIYNDTREYIFRINKSIFEGNQLSRESFKSNPYIPRLDDLHPVQFKDLNLNNKIQEIIVKMYNKLNSKYSNKYHEYSFKKQLDYRSLINKTTIKSENIYVEDDLTYIINIDQFATIGDCELYLDDLKYNIIQNIKNVDASDNTVRLQTHYPYLNPYLKKNILKISPNDPPDEKQAIDDLNKNYYNSWFYDSASKIEEVMLPLKLSKIKFKSTTPHTYENLKVDESSDYIINKTHKMAIEIIDFEKDTRDILQKCDYYRDKIEYFIQIIKEKDKEGKIEVSESGEIYLVNNFSNDKTKLTKRDSTSTHWRANFKIDASIKKLGIKVGENQIINDIDQGGSFWEGVKPYRLPIEDYNGLKITHIYLSGRTSTDEAQINPQDSIETVQSLLDKQEQNIIITLNFNSERTVSYVMNGDMEIGVISSGKIITKYIGEKGGVFLDDLITKDILDEWSNIRKKLLENGYTNGYTEPFKSSTGNIDVSDVKNINLEHHLESFKELIKTKNEKITVQVPDDFKREIEVKTGEPATKLVEIPTGYNNGETMTFEDKGTKYEIELPEGINDPKPSFEKYIDEKNKTVTVTVPKGLYAGDSFEYEYNDLDNDLDKETLRVLFPLKLEWLIDEVFEKQMKILYSEGNTAEIDRIKEYLDESIYSLKTPDAADSADDLKSYELKINYNNDDIYRTQIVSPDSPSDDEFYFSLNKEIIDNIISDKERSHFAALTYLEDYQGYNLLIPGKLIIDHPIPIKGKLLKGSNFAIDYNNTHLEITNFTGQKSTIIDDMTYFILIYKETLFNKDKIEIDHKIMRPLIVKECYGVYYSLYKPNTNTHEIIENKIKDRELLNKQVLGSNIKCYLISPILYSEIYLSNENIDNILKIKSKKIDNINEHKDIIYEINNMDDTDIPVLPPSFVIESIYNETADIIFDPNNIIFENERQSYNIVFDGDDKLKFSNFITEGKLNINSVTDQMALNLWELNGFRQDLENTLKEIMIDCSVVIEERTDGSLIIIKNIPLDSLCLDIYSMVNKNNSTYNINKIFNDKMIAMKLEQMDIDDIKDQSYLQTIYDMIYKSDDYKQDPRILFNKLLDGITISGPFSDIDFCIKKLDYDIFDPSHIIDSNMNDIETIDDYKRNDLLLKYSFVSLGFIVYNNQIWEGSILQENNDVKVLNDQTLIKDRDFLEMKSDTYIYGFSDRMYDYFLYNQSEDITNLCDIIIEDHGFKHVLHGIDMNIKLKDLLSSYIQINPKNHIISIKKYIERVEHPFYVKGSLFIDDTFIDNALQYNAPDSSDNTIIKNNLFHLIIDNLKNDKGQNISFIEEKELKEKDINYLTKYAYHINIDEYEISKIRSDIFDFFIKEYSNFYRKEKDTMEMKLNDLLNPLKDVISISSIDMPENEILKIILNDENIETTEDFFNGKFRVLHDLEIFNDEELKVKQYNRDSNAKILKNGEVIFVTKKLDDKVHFRVSENSNGWIKYKEKGINNLERIYSKKVVEKINPDDIDLSLVTKSDLVIDKVNNEVSKISQMLSENEIDLLQISKDSNNDIIKLLFDMNHIPYASLIEALKNELVNYINIYIKLKSKNAEIIYSDTKNQSILEKYVKDKISSITKNCKLENKINSEELYESLQGVEPKIYIASKSISEISLFPESRKDQIWKYEIDKVKTIINQEGLQDYINGQTIIKISEKTGVFIELCPTYHNGLTTYLNKKRITFKTLLHWYFANVYKNYSNIIKQIIQTDSIIDLYKLISHPVMKCLKSPNLESDTDIDFTDKDRKFTVKEIIFLVGMYRLYSNDSTMFKQIIDYFRVNSLKVKYENDSVLLTDNCNISDLLNYMINNNESVNEISRKYMEDNIPGHYLKLDNGKKNSISYGYTPEKDKQVELKKLFKGYIKDDFVDKLGYTFMGYNNIITIYSIFI